MAVLYVLVPMPPPRIGFSTAVSLVLPRFFGHNVSPRGIFLGPTSNKPGTMGLEVATKPPRKPNLERARGMTTKGTATTKGKPGKGANGMERPPL